MAPPSREGATTPSADLRGTPAPLVRMPELPDIALYLHALAPRVLGARLERIRLASPFVLRSTSPTVPEVEGKVVRQLRRLGKRIVFVFDDEYAIVLHLMIDGRLRWRRPEVGIPGKVG